MRKNLLGLLAAVLVIGVLLPLQPAAAAPTRAQLKARADVIEFDVTLPGFMKIYRNTKKGIDTRFAWSGYDGCSLPRALKPIASRWDKLFTNACYRHDFGYRNYGNGLALGSNQTYKSRIDKEFLANMRYTCTTKVVVASRNACFSAADAFYLGVSRFGKAQTAFFKGKCPANRFCLFDDKNYEDRRIALSSSENNMNDVSFGDKTSSVMNKTSVAWIVYDDKNYADRRFCLPPSVSVRNFGAAAYKFNDKTSSAKRLGSAKCPSGTPVIQQG
jgi:hypothetical protein